MINNTICSGVYDGRNYCVDLVTIQPVRLEDLKKNKCVIYGISGNWANISTNSALYLGSTNDEKHRVKDCHIRDLELRQHSNLHLQNAFNKHVNDFSFFELETCKEEKLLEREQNWLDFYNDNHNHKPLFNINKEAKMVADNSKEYIVTFPDGHEEIIKNLEKFCRINDLNSGHLGSVVHGRVGQHKGFKARKIGETGFKFISKKLERNENVANSLSREYLIITPENKQFKIRNLSKFCRENNLQTTLMVATSKGRRKHHKGFKCQKLENCG